MTGIRGGSLFVLLAIGISGCQQDADSSDRLIIPQATGTSSTRRVPVVQTRFGLMDTRCARSEGDPKEAASRCIVESSNATAKTVRAVRGASDFGSLFYFLFYLDAFPEQDVCRLLFGQADCYADLGIPVAPKPRPECDIDWLTSFILGNSVPAYCGSPVDPYYGWPRGTLLEATKVAYGTGASTNISIVDRGPGRPGVVYRTTCTGYDYDCTTVTTGSVPSTTIELIRGLLPRLGSYPPIDQTPGSIQCMAVSNESIVETADNGRVVLREQERPCGSTRKHPLAEADTLLSLLGQYTQGI